jgi:hypothetical protein
MSSSVEIAADKKLRELFDELKYTSKWASLDMSEKLRFLKNMKTTLVRMYELNAEQELQYLTVQFIEDHISERGFNRLRRLDDFSKSIEEKHFEVQMSDPEKRKQLIAELKAKLKAVDIDEV